MQELSWELAAFFNWYFLMTHGEYGQGARMSLPRLLTCSAFEHFFSTTNSIKKQLRQLFCLGP